jgi:putative flippase GtrA
MKISNRERSLRLGTNRGWLPSSAGSLLWEKTDDVLLQFLRYTCVGGIAFSVDFSTLFILTELFGIYYLISAAFAFVLGLVTNYCASVLWVFNKRTLQSRFLEFAAFALIGLVGLGLNEFFLWLFTEEFAIHYLLSKMISAVLVYLFNFISRRLVLFR